MAEGMVNQQYTERFRLAKTSGGDPITGETFTITNATLPNNTLWTGPALTEIGGGLYELAFTPDIDGVWQCTITGNSSGKVLIGEFDILSAPEQEFTRRANGQPILDSHINELQQGIEKALTVLGLS